MILPIEHIVVWKLIHKRKTVKIYYDAKFIIVDCDYQVSRHLFLRNNQTYNYVTPYKLP